MTITRLDAQERDDRRQLIKSGRGLATEMRPRPVKRTKIYLERCNSGATATRIKYIRIRACSSVIDVKT